jgi:hypothetical protein
MTVTLLSAPILGYNRLIVRFGVEEFHSKKKLSWPGFFFFFFFFFFLTKVNTSGILKIKLCPCTLRPMFRVQSEGWGECWTCVENFAGWTGHIGPQNSQSSVVCGMGVCDFYRNRNRTQFRLLLHPT